MLFVSSVLCGNVHAVDVVDFSKESPQLQLQKMRQQNAEMQLQINKFHQEFMSLRGEIEQLQYKVREIEKARQQEAQLKAQTSELLSAGGTATTAAGTLDTIKKGPGQEQIDALIARGDIGAYQSAFNDLKEKKYTRAQEGLNAYLAAYPQGEYVANAHYWLGEIYLLQNKSAQASKAFNGVITDYPTDSKADNARFKLAQIYNRSGDDSKAKELLAAVINSATADQRIKDMAKAFKLEHYPN